MHSYDSTAPASHRSHLSTAASAPASVPSTAVALAPFTGIGRLGGILLPALALLLTLLAPAPSAAKGRAEIQRITVVPDEVDVRVWTNKGEGSRYCVGEKIEISFRTNRDAWVAIIDFDTRGRAHRIFPNRFDREHFVRGGKTYRLPVDGYSFEVDGPPGREVVTAIASTDRRELLIESSRYLPSSSRGKGYSGKGYSGRGYSGKGYSGKVYTDRDDRYDDDRYEDDRYDDRRDDDRSYRRGASETFEHRNYERIVVTADSDVAFDSVSHRVRDGRRCHGYDRPRHRPWWF